MRSIKWIIGVWVLCALFLHGESYVYANTLSCENEKAVCTAEPKETAPFMTQGKIVMKKGTREQISWINRKPDTQVMYTVEDEELIQVSTGGAIISFEKEGVTKVTANLQQDGVSYKETVTVEVKGVTDTGLQMSRTSVYMEKGDLIQLTPKCIPEDAKDVINYTVSGAAIVTVDEHGILMAKQYGETKVIVSLANGVQTVCQVTVGTLATKLSVLYLPDYKITLGVGQSRKIYTKVFPENVSVKELLWESENPEIASVNQQGIVVGKKKGKVKIFVSTKDGSEIKKEIAVRIKKRDKGTEYSQNKLSIVSVDHQKYTFQEMVEDIKKLQKQYPEHISYKKIGKSYDNRAIYQVTMGNPNAKKVVLVQASIHGREYMTTQLVLKQLEFYCANYYSGIYEGMYFSELFEQVRFEIIPMVNPDGVTISQSGLSGIRNVSYRTKLKRICNKYGKGRSTYYTRWKANVRGVDLNRNFNQNWYKVKSTITKPCAYFYKGKQPESEKETKVLVEATNQINPNAVISYHAMGEVLYWDFGQKGKDRERQQNLMQVVKKISGYREMNTAYVNEISPGYGDWVAIRKKKPTITIEIGNVTCPLPQSQFERAWGKNCLMLAGVAKLYK